MGSGLPAWQPAIISTFFHLLLYMSYLANKIVVVLGEAGILGATVGAVLSQIF